jgi:ParB-like nuclease domain
MARRPPPDSGAPEIKLVPILELRPNPRNPNKHSEDQVNRLMAALRRDGQTRPLLARKANSMLIAGHGVHTAARRLGWEHISVVFLDVEQRDADRIMLSDDRLAALSELDQRRVADLLQEVADGDLMATGYSVEEAAKVLQSSEITDLEVYEIETSTVTDDFWIGVRGPMHLQADALQRMRTLLGEFPAVTIELGTVEDT